MLAGFRKRDRLIQLFLDAAGGDSWIVKRALEDVAQGAHPDTELSGDAILDRIKVLKEELKPVAA